MLNIDLCILGTLARLSILTSATSRSFQVDSSSTYREIATHVYLNLRRVRDLWQAHWGSVRPTPCWSCSNHGHRYVCKNASLRLIVLTWLCTTTESTNSNDEFRPTRRVRTAPGGETHDIFSHYVDDDALAAAPPKNEAAPEEQASTHSRYVSVSALACYLTGPI